MESHGKVQFVSLSLRFLSHMVTSGNKQLLQERHFFVCCKNTMSVEVNAKPSGMQLKYSLCSTEFSRSYKIWSHINMDRKDLLVHTFPSPANLTLPRVRLKAFKRKIKRIGDLQEQLFWVSGIMAVVWQSIPPSPTRCEHAPMLTHVPVPRCWSTCSLVAVCSASQHPSSSWDCSTAPARGSPAHAEITQHSGGLRMKIKVWCTSCQCSRAVRRLAILCWLMAKEISPTEQSAGVL